MSWPGPCSSRTTRAPPSASSAATTAPPAPAPITHTSASWTTCWAAAALTAAPPRVAAPAPRRSPARRPSRARARPPGRRSDRARASRRRPAARGGRAPAAPARAGGREGGGELAQGARLLLGAPLGCQARGLDQQQAPRLEEVARERGVDPIGEHQRLQAARAAPVEHAGGVPVPDLDQAQLLQALERLADRRHVDRELGGESALRRQPLAGPVAA